MSKGFLSLCLIVLLGPAVAAYLASTGGVRHGYQKGCVAMAEYITARLDIKITSYERLNATCQELYKADK